MGVNEIGSEKLDWVDLQFIDKLGYTDWELLRFWSPSSGILNIRKHNVSETWSVSVLRWG
jgi:hypothetical protein